MSALGKRLDKIESTLKEIKAGGPDECENELERIRSNDLTDFEKEYLEGSEGELVKCIALKHAKGLPEFCKEWEIPLPISTPAGRRHGKLVMKYLKLRCADYYIDPPRADLEAAEAAALEEEEAEAKLAQGNPKHPSS